ATGQGQSQRSRTAGVGATANGNRRSCIYAAGNRSNRARPQNRSSAPRGPRNPQACCVPTGFVDDTTPDIVYGSGTVRCRSLPLTPSVKLPILPAQPVTSPVDLQRTNRNPTP